MVFGTGGGLAMRTSTTIAALIIATTALAGCGSDEPEAIPTPTSTPTTEGTTASPSPSPTETMSAEQQAAEEALDRFVQVRTQLYADTNANLAALDDVSYGIARSRAEAYLRQARERGIEQSGPTEIVSRELTSNELDDEPPTLVFEECTDVSQLEITENGEPFEGTRTDRNLTRYWVSFWEDKWQVSAIELSGPDQC